MFNWILNTRRRLARSPTFMKETPFYSKVFIDHLTEFYPQAYTTSKESIENN